MLKGKPLGVLRFHSAESWELTIQEMSFLQAIAEIVALVLDNLRVSHAYKDNYRAVEGHAVGYGVP